MSLELEQLDTPHGPIEAVKWTDPNPYAVYKVRRAKNRVAAGRAVEDEPDVDSVPLDIPTPVTPEPLA